MLRLRNAAWIAALFVTQVFAQQVTIEHQTALYAENRLNARVVAQLREGEHAEVQGKSGPWLNVKTSNVSGWLLSFNVRFASERGDQGSSPGENVSVAGRFVAPRTNIRVTSVMGIRGLDEEDLRQARFDSEQLQLLERYTASRYESEMAAQTSGLAPARVDYFDKKQPQ